MSGEPENTRHILSVEPKSEKATEDNKDDNIDLFSELEVVFIGKHSFDNKEIIENFGPVDGFAEEHLVALLKKVFQNKYPITRSHGLPKIPSKDNDKILLLKGLYNYFNNLRRKIIRERKQEGNSMMLRESIGHLEEIKMLIEHFEEDKAKFPYHLFREYMDNSDYYSNEGDMHEQLIKIRTKKHDANHIKNLLRQFAKIYLLNQGKENITVGGPGVTREDFEKFRSTVKHVPPIISSLIDLLENRTKSLEDTNEEVDYSSLMDLIKKLDSEFTTIKDDVTPETQGFASQTGGDKTEESKEALLKLVNKIFEEYKVLKTREKAKITTTQGELASIEATTRELNELRDKLKEAEAKGEGLDPDTILELDKELTKTKKLLGVVQPQLETLITENQQLKANYEKVLADGQGWVKAYEELQTKIATLKAEHERQDEFSNKLSEGAITNAKRSLEEKHQALISQMESELKAHKNDGSECAVAYGKLSDEIRALQETHERREKLSNEIAMGAIRDTEAKYEKRISELEDKGVKNKNANSKVFTDLSGNPISAVEYGNQWKEAYENMTESQKKWETYAKELEEKEKALSSERNAIKLERNALKSEVGKITDTSGVTFNADKYGNQWKEAYEDMTKSQKQWETYAKELEEKEKTLIRERNDLKSEVGKITNTTGEKFNANTYGKRWEEAYKDLEEKGKALESETKALKSERNALRSQVGKITNTTGKTFNSDKYGNEWKEAYENMKKSQEEWEAYAKGLENNNLVKAYKLFGLINEGQTIEDINKSYKEDTSMNDTIPAQIKKIMNEHINETEYKDAKQIIMKDLKITDQEVEAAQEGGATKLLDYSMKVADNRLNDFLTKEPLPFASLITDFEKSSKLNIVRETNEKHMLEEFVLYQLNKYFKDDKMKEFFYEFNILFEHINFIELTKLCVSMYEICNSISKSKEDLDVVRLESKEYNGLLDQIQNLLKACTFDFYEVASKEMLQIKLIDIKYHDKYTYFKPDTKSFEHTYSIDDSLKLIKKSYDYNEEIYTINNKVLYFFFILSTYNVIKKDIKERKIVETLIKNTRTLKRNYKKSAKVRWRTK